MYERFGTGHGFNLLCLLGFLMTVTAACLTRMTLFTFAVGLKLKHSSVRAVFGTVIAVWSLAAMLLSRSHGELPQYAVMLTSPFGTTLPVGGWCTAIIMGICEGSFAAVLPGLLLYPAYILLLVLVLCAMDKEHYDSACLVLLGGNKQVGRSCENRIVCKVREVSAKAASAVGSSGASLLEKLHMPFLAAEYRRIITEKSNSPYLPHGGYSPLSFIFSLFCGIFTAVSGDGKEVLFRVLMISVYIQLFGLLRVQPFEAYTSDIRGLMLRSSAAALTELPAAVFESAVIMSLAALLNGIPASAAVGMAVIRVLIAAAIPFVYNLLQSVSSSRTAVLTFLITAASAVSAFLVR